MNYCPRPLDSYATPAVWAVFCLCCFHATPMAYPQEAATEDTPAASPRAPASDATETLVALGPGVHLVKRSNNNAVTSLVTIGQARISTALGKAKGLERARRIASQSADIEFLKWLKSKVSVAETEDSEDIILLENDGGKVPKETGKALEKTSRKMELYSEGLLRGLQVIHVDQDPESEMITVVKGWKADTAEGTKKVAALMADDEEPVDRESIASGAVDSKTSSVTGEKPLKKKSTSSDDADDFLK